MGKGKLQGWGVGEGFGWGRPAGQKKLPLKMERTKKSLRAKGVLIGEPRLSTACDMRLSPRDTQGKKKHININKFAGLSLVPGLGECQKFVYVFFWVIP